MTVVFPMYDLCSQTLIIYVSYLSVQWYLEDMKLILVINMTTNNNHKYICVLILAIDVWLTTKVLQATLKFSLLI